MGILPLFLCHRSEGAVNSTNHLPVIIEENQSMEFIKWDASFSVGVAALDEEHKELFAAIHELYEAMKNGQSKDIIGKTMERLDYYYHTHFAHEEHFFAKTKYPDAAVHMKEHDCFRKQIMEIQAKCRDNMGGSEAIGLMNFLRNWLVNHVLTVDPKYTAHLTANGIK
jgi:hemerythrin-like metal-binding protein